MTGKRAKEILLKVLKFISIYLFMALGAIIAAFAIDAFLIPYKVVPGGVSGLSAVIHFVTGKRVSIGTAMILINIPLFIFGWKVLGRRFLFRTIFATIIMSLAVDFLQPFIISYVAPLLEEAGTQDLMLFAVIGGVIEGVGLGMVIKVESTTGGSDLLAATLNRLFPGLTVGNLLLIIDFVVVVTAIFTFGSLLLGLYSMIVIFLTSKVIDMIVEGFSFSRAFYIFSDKYEEIANRILTETGRGLTYIKGVGAYTGNDKNILICVAQRAQLPKIKGIIKSVDPRAFVMVLDAHEVLGEGFRELK